MSSAAVGFPRDSTPLGAIETTRLRLDPIDTDALEAFGEGDPLRAAALMRLQLGEGCDLYPALAWLRLSQLRGDPTLREWLLRAIVRRSDSRMIGHAGFHTAPNPEYLRELAPGAVEIGYEIYPPYRRNGYALEAVTALLEWAARLHGIHSFVASISPENVASFGLIQKLNGAYEIGKAGAYDDPEDGPEDIYVLRCIPGQCAN